MSHNTWLALYRHILALYPPAFQAEYAEEMLAVYAQALRGSKRCPTWRLALGELLAAPPVILRLYWREWQSGGLRTLFFRQELPVWDGRHSWGQAGLESLFFLLWTIGLLLLTYGNVALLPAGWYRDLGLLGWMALWLPLPFWLLGLGSSLPRWTYPLLGAGLSYLVLAARQFNLGLALLVSLAAAVLLVWVAVRVNARRPLPEGVRRLGHSLRLDPLRWSFGVYGAAPLLVLRAFDDGRTNHLTPWLAIAALGVLFGALLYTRLHSPLGRAAALVTGLFLGTLPALLDRAAFGVLDPAETAQIFGLWGFAALLVVLPLFLGRPLLAPMEGR